MKPLFPYATELTAIAIAYKNISYIADSVLPRVPVGKKEFKYYEFPLSEGFTIPHTAYPKKGKPNEVEFSGVEKVEKTLDYGLDDIISNDDIANSPEGYDPKAFSVQSITDLIALDREVRAANILFNAANYALDKQIVLSGSSQFSDPTSDPLGVITEALDACLIRPNTMTIGRAAWSVLMRHPDIIKATQRNAGDTGIASLAAVAELFELQNIYVGESYFNTARKGQNVTLSRVWGKHIALTYINPLANSQGGITFGFTAQYGTKVAGSQPEDAGINGSERVRCAESVKELIVAPDCGYFIENAVA